MDEKPKRRWFRFKLSTVLILTAIAAWGMAEKPLTPILYEIRDPISSERAAFRRKRGKSVTSIVMRDRHKSEDIRVGGGVPWFDQAISLQPKGFDAPVAHGLNPGLIWPATALAAFTAWKAMRAVLEHGRVRRTKPL